MQFVFAGHTHYAHLRGWERQVTVHLFVRVCPVLLLHHFLEISIFTKCYFDSLVCDWLCLFPKIGYKSFIIKKDVEQLDKQHVWDYMVSDSAHYPDGICFLSNKPLTIVKMILVTNLLNSLRICYFNPMLLSKLTIKNQNSIPVFIAKPAIVRNPPLAARTLLKVCVLFWSHVKN